MKNPLYKEYERIENDIERHRKLVQLGITLDQVRDRVSEMQDELEKLYQEARELQIEINHISGKVVA